MVIEGAISMRAAARISGLVNEFTGGHQLDGLSHTTVQNYLLRLGLDRIENGIGFSVKQVWIVDHLIAAGSLKCLVVVGIDLDRFMQIERPLQHQDMVVLLLEPTEASNGNVVQTQLTALAKKRGVPEAILSDRGSDLKKGVELMQQTSPDLIALYDIVHMVSRLIWKFLTKDDRFSQYRQAGCECANKLRQSSLAHLKPPKPKTKARYMNLEPEIRWGRRALWLLDRVRLDDLNPRQRERLNREKVEQQLAWLDGYRAELGVWSELSSLGQQCCTVVRRHGYSPQTMAAMRVSLGTGKSPAGQEFITKLLEMVEEQCSRCPSEYARMPGTSEVLESLIGTGKRLLGTSQNNNSLTGQILSIAAATVTIASETLYESLDRCRIKHLKEWLADHIRPGVHNARREDLTEPDGGINIAQTKNAAIPNF